MPWAKGQSGNPAGRRKEKGDLRQLARAHTAEAIATLVSVMRDGDTSTARANAADKILDRAYGKPAQAITGDEDAAPIKTILEVVWGTSSGARS